MTKPEMIAVSLSVAALFAGLFAAFESHRSSDSFASLEQKLTRLESPSNTSAVAPAGPSNADLARDISTLRSQIAALSSTPGVAASNPGWKPPPVTAKVDPAALPGTPEQREDAERRRLRVVDGQAKGISDVLVEKLGLTEQQNTQVRGIVYALVEEWQTKRTSVPQADMKQALADFLVDANAKLKVGLTQEQQAKYDDLTKGPNGFFGIRPAGSLLNESGKAMGSQ